MDEFSLINQWKQSYYRQASTIKGIGDDAAVLSIPSHKLVTAVDTFVEDVHFSKQTMEAFHIGYRALAANISDIIIMGGRPIAYLVSIVMPPHYDQAALKEIYEGIDYLAKAHQMDLVGGDTTTGSELVLSITVIGHTNNSAIRYRHEAAPDDLVFVTGTLGDASAGLAILLENLSLEDQAKHYLIKRHRMPNLRSNFMEELTHIKRMATNDISDGLANECHEIAQASDLTIVIDEGKIPLSDAIQHFSPERTFQWKLFGGEDFEMLCTVSKADWPLVQQIAKDTKTSVTEIGYVTEKQAFPVYIKQAETINPLPKDGYIHQSR